MTRFWDKLAPPQKGPSPEIVEELKHSKEQLRRVEERTDLVQKISLWMDARNDQNHFGDAVDISFTPRKRHA